MNGSIDRYLAVLVETDGKDPVSHNQFGNRIAAGTISSWNTVIPEVRVCVVVE